MPSITVTRDIDGSSKEIFKTLRKYCDDKLILSTLGNLKPQLKWDAKKKQGTFREMGVEGTVAVTSNSPCQISVTMNIPILMTPLKGVLKESIQKHLAKVF